MPGDWLQPGKKTPLGTQGQRRKQHQRLGMAEAGLKLLGGGVFFLLFFFLGKIVFFGF